MTHEQNLDLARRHLRRYTLANAVTFRGMTLDNFDAEELRKICEIADEQYRRDRAMHEVEVDGFRTLARGRTERRVGVLRSVNWDGATIFICVVGTCTAMVLWMLLWFR